MNKKKSHGGEQCSFSNIVQAFLLIIRAKTQSDIGGRAVMDGVRAWHLHLALNNRSTILPSSLLSLMLLQATASVFADIHRKLYTPNRSKSDWDVPCSLLCFSTLLPCLFLIYQGPSLRQTHTLTKGCHHSNKREKAKKIHCEEGGENTVRGRETERESIT